MITIYLKNGDELKFDNVISTHLKFSHKESSDKDSQVLEEEFDLNDIVGYSISE